MKYKDVMIKLAGPRPDEKRTVAEGGRQAQNAFKMNDALTHGTQGIWNMHAPFSTHGVSRENAFSGTYAPINIHGRYNYTPKGSKQATSVNLEKAPIVQNLRKWQPQELYQYSDIYNAAAGSPTAYADYMNYLRAQPVNALGKVMLPGAMNNVPTSAAFVEGLGNGPQFRQYNSTPTDIKKNVAYVPDLTNTFSSVMGPHYMPYQSQWTRFTGFLKNKPGNFGNSGKPEDYKFSYITAAHPTQAERRDARLYTNPSDFFNTFNWNANSLGPQSINSTATNDLRFHEATHASQLLGMHSRPLPLANAQSGKAYELMGAEQAQAARHLNVALLALQNKIKAGDMQSMTPEERALAMKYPAYGTKEQFMERNNEFLKNPAFVQKYLGAEATRPLAGIDANQRALARGKTLGSWNYMNSAFDTAVQQVNSRKYKPGSPMYKRLQKYINDAQALSPQGQQVIQRGIDRMNDYYWM